MSRWRPRRSVAVGRHPGHGHVGQGRRARPGCPPSTGRPSLRLAVGGASTPSAPVPAAGPVVGGDSTGWCAEDHGRRRVEEPDRPPALFFPAADVAPSTWSSLPGRPAGRGPGAGPSQRRAGGSRGVVERARRDTASRPSGRGPPWPEQGRDVGHGRQPVGPSVSFDREDPPSVHLEWLSGLAAFDHVRVEPGGRPRARGSPPPTSARPAPTGADVDGHAQAVPDLGRRHRPDRPAGRAAPRSTALRQRRPRRLAPAGGRGQPDARPGDRRRRPARPGRREPCRPTWCSCGRPMPAGRSTFDLEELSTGRNFTTLAAVVDQGGGAVRQRHPAARRHRRRRDPPRSAPRRPGPDDSEPYDMGVTGRDLRIVDGAYTDDPDAPAGPPALDAWVRSATCPTTGPARGVAGPVHRAPLDRGRAAPHEGSAGARPTARCRRRSTPSASRCTATCGPTAGCSTGTTRRSPATA